MLVSKSVNMENAFEFYFIKLFVNVKKLLVVLSNGVLNLNTNDKYYCENE